MPFPGIPSPFFGADTGTIFPFAYVLASLDNRGAPDGVLTGDTGTGNGAGGDGEKP